MDAVSFRSNEERSLRSTLEQHLGLGAFNCPEPHRLILVWNVLVGTGRLQVLQQFIQRQQSVAETEQLATTTTTTTKLIQRPVFLNK